MCKNYEDFHLYSERYPYHVEGKLIHLMVKTRKNFKLETTQGLKWCKGQALYDTTNFTCFTFNSHLIEIIPPSDHMAQSDEHVVLLDW